VSEREDLLRLLAETDGQVIEGLSDAFYGRCADAILAAGYRKPSPWIPADHHDGGGYKVAESGDIPWLLVNREWLMSEVNRLTPRTITTAAELDALGFRAVILDADEDALTCTAASPHTGNEWMYAGESYTLTSGQIADLGPATVLHEGER
jgi:hypothetical protein